eukprot:scaffold613_cov243-Pinguiococcus_pyrenoidosus.AAC.42
MHHKRRGVPDAREDFGRVVPAAGEMLIVRMGRGSVSEHELDPVIVLLGARLRVEDDGDAVRTGEGDLLGRVVIVEIRVGALEDLLLAPSSASAAVLDHDELRRAFRLRLDGLRNPLLFLNSEDLGFHVACDALERLGLLGHEARLGRLLWIELAQVLSRARVGHHVALRQNAGEMEDPVIQDRQGQVPAVGDAPIRGDGFHVHEPAPIIDGAVRVPVHDHVIGFDDKRSIVVNTRPIPSPAIFAAGVPLQAKVLQTKAKEALLVGHQAPRHPALPCLPPDDCRSCRA